MVPTFFFSVDFFQLGHKKQIGESNKGFFGIKKKSLYLEKKN